MAILIVGDFRHFDVGDGDFIEVLTGSDAEPKFADRDACDFEGGLGGGGIFGLKEVDFLPLRVLEMEFKGFFFRKGDLEVDGVFLAFFEGESGFDESATLVVISGHFGDLEVSGVSVVAMPDVALRTLFEAADDFAVGEIEELRVFVLGDFFNFDVLDDDLVDLGAELDAEPKRAFVGLVDFKFHALAANAIDECEAFLDFGPLFVLEDDLKRLLFLGFDFEGDFVFFSLLELDAGIDESAAFVDLAFVGLGDFEMGFVTEEVGPDLAFGAIAKAREDLVGQVEAVGVFVFDFFDFDRADDDFVDLGAELEGDPKGAFGLLGDRKEDVFGADGIDECEAFIDLGPLFVLEDELKRLVLDGGDVERNVIGLAGF